MHWRGLGQRKCALLPGGDLPWEADNRSGELLLRTEDSQNYNYKWIETKDISKFLS